MPRRPDVPPSAYALVTVIVVERALLQEGKPWLEGRGGLAACVAVVALVLVGMVARPVRPLCLLIAVATLCAFVLASLALFRAARLSASLDATSPAQWEFRVDEDGSEGARGFRCRASALWEGGDQGSVWLVSSEPLDVGSRIRCVGSFSALGDDEWAISSRMQGICGTVRIVRIADSIPPEGVLGTVGSLRRAVLESLRPEKSDARALLAGCVCGWRRALHERGLDELFARCGTAHLVAVSGGHLSILLGLIEAGLEACSFGPRHRCASLIAMGGVFVLLCGAPASALRAWAMTGVALWGKLVGRRAHALSGVCVVGLVMALWDPALSGRLGFVLSVTSVCGLCMLGPYGTYAAEQVLPHIVLPRWLPKGVRRRFAKAMTGLKQSMGASVVALMVTLPLVAPVFGVVSLAGPLANALVATPFTLMVGAGIVAGALWWLPPVQGPVLLLCDGLATVVLWLLRLVDALLLPQLPVNGGSPLPWACVAMLVALLVVWPRIAPGRIRLALLAGALIVAVTVFRWRFFAPARICVLDVGQGDAILVQDGACAVLVDAGPDDAVVDALWRNHVVHLDAVVVTHLHDDHYAGIEYLGGRVACDRVVVAQGVASHLTGEVGDAVKSVAPGNVEEICYGDVLRIGGFALRMVSPTGPVAGDENPDSIGLLASYDENGRQLTALLTGDAEREETGAALARGDLCDVDFLKVGHHGSAVSVDAELATALDPEVSVASAGAGNSYGHPDPECVRILEAADSEFLCTKDVGDVDVRPGTDGPAVRTQHPNERLSGRTMDMIVDKLRHFWISSWSSWI
ncbi:MAG: ComEC/Rec2 family competence protein [Atopobiaceae bacterium]|nr:ComEC/Rec2 family competence protein [Atopobiaceae bacterium]